MMGEDDTRALVDGADFYGPLVDYLYYKGNKVEYVGHQTVDGDRYSGAQGNDQKWRRLHQILRSDPDTFLS